MTPEQMLEELTRLREEVQQLKVVMNAQKNQHIKAADAAAEDYMKGIEELKKENRILQARITQVEAESLDKSRFIFSNSLLLQNDRTVSLSASGNRLLFKRQQLSHDILAQSIEGPLKEAMNTMIDSTVHTSRLTETYQLVLGGLTYLQSSTDIKDKESLLECMGRFQIWLTKACKDRTSILGLVLARIIKIIQDDSQSDPCFSIDKFNAARMIDSRNSELPETVFVIADGFTGIILLVQGADIRVCQATDIFMRQQEDRGMQLVFDEALNLPNLQLLANSFPDMDRWEPLGSWAVEVGRFNFMKRLGRVYKPEEFEEL